MFNESNNCNIFRMMYVVPNYLCKHSINLCWPVYRNSW